MNIRKFLPRAVVVATFLTSGTAAFAVPTAYTDRTAFDTAIAGLSQSILDFDSLSDGDPINDGDTVEGITFNYPVLAGFGVTMEVVDEFDTTSSPNYLGTDDGGVFQDGDDFNLGFAAANAIGMFFLTADAMFSGDILLHAGGKTASLLTPPQQTLADGTDVYFLGIVDDAATFTSADIDTGNTLGGPFFLYNVDDILLARVKCGAGAVSGWFGRAGSCRHRI